MAEKIYGKDLYGDDGVLDKLEKQLIRIGDIHQAQIEAIKKRAKELEQQLNKVNASTVKQRDVIVDASKETDKLTRAYAKQEEALSVNAMQIEEVRLATRKLNQVNKLEAKLNAAKEGSYNRLSAQYSLLKIKINDLTVEERKNTVQGRALVRQSKEIFESMKDLQEETGKTALNVGNYTEAMKDAIKQTLGFDKVLGGLSKNPIVLFFGLVAGALTALFAAFKRTEGGAELFAKIGGVIEGVWSAVIGIVDRFAKGATAAFNDPQQAAEDFIEFLKNQIINRVQAAINIFGALGKAITAVWQRDLKALKEAGVEASQAVIQSITGLDPAQQKAVIDGIREETKAIVDNANAFAQLAQARRDVARANRALTRDIEKLATEEARLNAIAGDSTRSFKEIEEANKAAAKATEERGRLEIKVARNSLSLINREISLRRKNGEDLEGLFDQQIQGLQAVAAAERELLEATLSNEAERRQLIQDRAERDLDILIDGFDNQKGILERQLKDETRNFEERRRILEEIPQLADASFAKQVESLQQFTAVQINANDLLQESDAVTLNEKIRALGLSEILEGRLLEVVRERRLVNQDLIELNQDLTKSEEAAAQAALTRANAQREAAFQEAQARVNQEAALAESEFSLIERTEAEKTQFRLKAEKDRLLSILELNEQFGRDLSELQIQTVKNQVAALDRQLGALSEGRKSIFDVFGLTVNDEQKQRLTEAFNFAKEQFASVAAERSRLADQNVQRADQNVQSAEQELQAQINLAAAGKAARIGAAREELEEAKANQSKALNEQRKAQRQQQNIQTAEQASNLLTTVSKVYSQFGFPLGLAFSGLMLGSFIAARLRIASLTSRQLGDGDAIAIDGPSHGTGGNVFLGTHGNTKLYGEGGEVMGVFNKQAVKKYPDLMSWIKDINNGDFSPTMGLMQSSIGSVYVNQNNTDVDTRKMESHLAGIARNTSTTITNRADGARIETRGSTTTIIK